MKPKKSMPDEISIKKDHKSEVSTKGQNSLSVRKFE